MTRSSFVALRLVSECIDLDIRIPRTSAHVLLFKLCDPSKKFTLMRIALALALSLSPARSLSLS